MAVRYGSAASACVQPIRWYADFRAARGTNMPLTDLAFKRALPGAKIVMLSDGGGLQLWIMPDGAERLRLAYRLVARKRPSPLAPS